MPELELICENIDSKIGFEKTNQNFRLFLSTFPTDAFPISILMNGIKITNEPPKGLKSNLAVSLTNDLISDKNFFEKHPKPTQFKSLLYGLCFLHSLILDFLYKL